MKKLFFTENRFIYEGGTPGVTTSGNEVYDTPETTVAAAPNLPAAQPVASEAPKPITSPEAAKTAPSVMPEAPKGPETPVVTAEQVAKATDAIKQKAGKFTDARRGNLTTLAEVKLEELPTLTSKVA